MKKRKQHIYVIRNTENSRIKVGISLDPKSRFNNLRCASGCELEMLFVSKGTIDAENIEGKIHEQLDEFRYIGEWFNADSDLVMNIVNSYAISNPVEKKKTKESPINLNKYSRVKSGVYKDTEGNLYSIKYIDGKWEVLQLERID